MRIPIEIKDRTERLREPVNRHSGFRGIDALHNPHGYGTNPSMTPEDHPARVEPDRDEYVRSPRHAAGELRRDDRRVGTIREGLNRSVPPSAHRDPLPAEQTEGSEEEWKNRYLRLLADFENHKRKTQEERKHQAEMGKDAMLDDIFPILDHMENAIQAARETGEHSGIVEGLDLVREEFFKALQKHGVEKVGTVGESFDPNVHEAVAVLQTDAHPENTVVQEVRNGFFRGKKLLRPARVIVSR